MKTEEIKHKVSKIALLSEVLEDHLTSEFTEAAKSVGKRLVSEIRELDDELNSSEDEPKKTSITGAEIKVDTVKTKAKPPASIVNNGKVETKPPNTADKLKSLGGNTVVKQDNNGLI